MPSRRLASSVATAWVVVALELVAVALARRAQFASVWELQNGSLWLAPTALLLAGAIGLVGGGLLELARLGDRGWARGLLSALAAAGSGAMAWSVSSGRHFAQWPVRVGFISVAVLAAGGVVALVAPRLARCVAHRSRPTALAAGLLLIVLELVNGFTLVRLYPGWHTSLAIVVLLLAPWMLLALDSARATDDGCQSAEQARASTGTSLRARLWLPGSVLLLALLALAAGPSARRLSHFDNFRLLLLDHAPLLGQAVQMAARMAPPPSLDSPDCIGPGGSPAPGLCPSESSPAARGALHLQGRDVLLLSIDALRADHVGVYGYGRPTTPNIDALASEGVMFEYAYSPTPHTSYAVTSLMTGKYMRPLLLQGIGEDSDTWASILRTYGYRTAGFYPPAVFFIDEARFSGFQKSYLGFEYRKVEFLEGNGRVAQIKRYLEGETPGRRQFVWLHLFGPHEPYDAHAEHHFGDRDIDRYDEEIAAADATVGQVVALFRQRSPDGVIIVTADHGEEFGDHGGRYHGSSVYEEQVRVPLIVAAQGAFKPRKIAEPVQIIDLLPTLLAGLDIPRPARIRGRDLTALLASTRPEGQGFAFAETDADTLLVEGPWRLICARALGACRLYDISSDRAEVHDLAGAQADRFRALRDVQRRFSASHGRFEEQGRRAEGRGWPDAIVRGTSGDADAAEELMALLDDADVALRRKAAEVLFGLKSEQAAPALRLALSRDEDTEVRSWAALALTRLGQGAPLAFELARSEQLRWRRLAALALAEAGDGRGEQTLIDWWKDKSARDFRRSCELLDALAQIRSKDAAWWLTRSLDDVRLRPRVARALAAIGERSARGPLVVAFAKERYQSARVALGRALVDLGGKEELAVPLTRFLGVPDPLAGGLGLALRAGILEHLGGPSRRQLGELRNQSNMGAAFRALIPRGGNGSGVRVLVRGKAEQRDGEVRVGKRLEPLVHQLTDEPITYRKIPTIDPKAMVRIALPASAQTTEVWGRVPDSVGLAPGQSVDLVLVADGNVTVEAVAVVPLADELPAPAPEPWHPDPVPPAAP
ncbi:MAG: sulfatase-like hydrolase/transferase [Polyangiaceae bacterium]|nr:sulfatase-like hydrolase/transferase [Polyangiaceae bacterium]